MYTVYILYSNSLKKFYTGYTGNLEQRLAFHNASVNSFSKKGIPWVLIKRFELPDKSSAMALEQQIKKNGGKRYLERNNIDYKI